MGYAAEVLNFKSLNDKLLLSWKGAVVAVNISATGINVCNLVKQEVHKGWNMAEKYQFPVASLKLGVQHQTQPQEHKV